MLNSFNDLLTIESLSEYQWERLENITLAYKRHLDALKTVGQSTSDHIIELWEYELDHVNNLCYTDWWLRRNEFPYILPKDCEHYVLWLRNASRYFNETEIKTSLETMLDRDFVFWMNPAVKQSVPDLVHYQVIVKR